MKLSQTFLTFTMLVTTMSTIAMFETGKLTEEQMHLSSLELEIVKLENRLQDLVKNKRSASEQAALRTQLEDLKKRKASEDRLNKYRDELGALDAALQANREILTQLSKELEKLQQPVKIDDAGKKKAAMRRIEKQHKNIEAQKQKLHNVLQSLEREREAANLRLIGASQKTEG